MHCVRCDFNHTDADIVQISERFDTFWFELLLGPLQYRQGRHAEQRRPHGVRLWHPTGAVNLSPFSRVHLVEHGCRCFAVPFIHKRCEIRYVCGRFRKHRRPFDRAERVRAVQRAQVSFSPRGTCHAHPRTPTPSCLASRLISSRGRHFRMVPAARKNFHVIPTQTGRPCSLKAVRLDCRKSCQTSGWKALGPSMIRLHEASMPAPRFSRPT